MNNRRLLQLLALGLLTMGLLASDAIAQGNTVEFTSDPPPESIICGELLTHTFHAEASNGGEVRYRFEITPDDRNAQYNEETGVFTWITNSPSTITGVVTAYLVDDPEAKDVQNFTIKSQYGDPQGEKLFFFSQPPATAFVGEPYQYQAKAITSSGQGTVTYELAAGAPNGMMINAATGQLSWTPQAAGNYTATIKASLVEDANVTATQSMAVTVHDNAAQNFKVSGRVVRESDGASITAMVTFVPQGSNTVDPTTVMTASDGSYEVSLSNQHTYIAYAVGANGNSIDESLLPQYYARTNDIAYALPIRLTADRNDIHFVLSSASAIRPNEVTGSIRNISGDPLKGFVTAVRVVNTPGKDAQLVDARTTATDYSGNYRFANLEPGEYIFVGLSAGQGYCKQGGEATRHWKEASRVQITETAGQSNLTINLIPPVTTKGTGSVGGNITAQNGTTAQSVGGALIYLLDSDGKIAANTMSGYDGTFTMPELPLGSYTLIIDKVGFAPVTKSVTLDDHQTEFTTDVMLQVGSASDATAEAHNAGFALYPNPANSHLLLSLPRGEFRLTIVAVDGTQVGSMEVGSIEAASRHRLPIDGLRPGVYMARLVGASSQATIPFTVVR